MDWSMQHVLSLEDELKAIQMNDYELALQNLWWDKLGSKRPLGARQETWDFLLATASIERLDPGEMKYDSMVRSFLQLKSEDMGKGLKVSRNQFEDDKISFASEWAAQIGADMALVPQRQIVQLLLNGEAAGSLGYDGKPFFATDHPVNPAATGQGTYSNLKAANPLVDVNGLVIPANYNLAEAALRSMVMPSGQNRNLSPTIMVVGPALKLAGQTITQGRVITATDNVAAGGYKFNGKIDTGVELIVVNEITDLSWFLVAGSAGTQLLPFIYGERKPYTMTTYDGMTDAELGRRNEIEWQVRGRNVAIYGHPFQIVKSKP